MFSRTFENERDKYRKNDFSEKGQKLYFYGKTVSLKTIVTNEDTAMRQGLSYLIQCISTTDKCT
jgi:hypothetical protein